MDVMLERVQKQRAINRQLRRESTLERHPISQSYTEMVNYIQENQHEDALVTGFADEKSNSFRERRTCAVL